MMIVASPPYLRAWVHRAFRYGYEFVYHPEEAAGIFAAQARAGVRRTPH